MIKRQTYRTLNASPSTLKDITRAATENRFKNKLITAGFRINDDILNSYEILYSNTNDWLGIYTEGNLIFSYDRQRGVRTKL